MTILILLALMAQEQAPARAATFNTHLSKAELEKLQALVAQCRTAQCFRDVAEDFFDRSDKNLGAAIQAIPKPLQTELQLAGCYRKGVYATQIIGCEKKIFNVVSSQLDAIDTKGDSMSGVPMPGAVRSLAIQTCMPKGTVTDDAIDGAMANPETDRCVRDTVVSLQKRFTDVKQIANASDLQNRRAMVINELCWKTAAKLKFDRDTCEGTAPRADLLAKMMKTALTSDSIALDHEIADGRPGLEVPGQDKGAEAPLDTLYDGRYRGVDGGLHCPSFIPHIFCGDGKYDPRKYKKSENDTGLFAYDEKAAVPDTLANIREMMGPVYDGVLGELFKKDLAEHVATRALENALQTAALGLDTEGFNSAVDELADASACLPSYRDSAAVKRMAAAIPLSRNSSSPKTAQLQADYRANMAVAAQCAAALGNRTRGLREDLGMNARPVGPWINPEDLTRSFGKVGGFLAEMAIGFNPGVSMIVFNPNFVHADELVKAKCTMINERMIPYRMNQCTDMRYEFTLETNELNVLMNQYPPLAETSGSGMGLDAIVAAGGIDPRLASYDLDPSRHRDADNALTDEKGEMIFCMDRAKRLGVKPSPKALEAADKLVKDTVHRQLDGFEKQIRQSCDNPTAVAVDAIQDPATMEEYFSCSRPRFGNLARFLELTPAEIDGFGAKLSRTDCADRLSSSIAACYFYRHVQGSQELKKMGQEVAIHAASLAMDAVGLIGFGGMVKSVGQIGLRKIFSRMALQAVKSALTPAALARAAGTGAAFGIGTALIEKGTQLASGGTEGQLAQRAEAEQQRVRGGHGSYDNLVAAKAALDEASRRNPMIEAAVKGAAAGVMFGVAMAPFEAGAAAAGHAAASPPPRGGLSPEVLQAARETLPQLWGDLERTGAFKDPAMARQLDNGMRPIMKSLLADGDPKLTPAAIEKLPTKVIAKRLRDLNAANNIPETPSAVADGAVVPPSPRLLELEAVSAFDSSKGDPAQTPGLVEAARKIVRDADPEGEIPEDTAALMSKARDIAKERLEGIDKAVGDLRELDLDAGNTVANSPDLKLQSEELLAIYKRLREKGNSPESLRKLFDRLTRECPIGPAAIAAVFQECGVLLL